MDITKQPEPIPSPQAGVKGRFEAWEINSICATSVLQAFKAVTRVMPCNCPKSKNKYQKQNHKKKPPLCPRHTFIAQSEQILKNTVWDVGEREVARSIQLDYYENCQERDKHVNFDPGQKCARCGWVYNGPPKTRIEPVTTL